MQVKKINDEKNNSYYQQYDVKQLIAFHKQAMTKQQIYNNILARRSGMDYSQGIQFETSIINMEEAQELPMKNQPKNQQKRCWCGSIKHSRVTSKDCPVGLTIRKSKKSALGMALSKSEEKRQQNMHQQRKRENVWRKRPLGRAKNQMTGHQQEMWCKIWMLRQ